MPHCELHDQQQRDAIQPCQNFRTQALAPVEIFFDGEYRRGTRRPPQSRLASAELQNIFVGKVSLRKKINCGIRVPWQRGAIRCTCGRGDTAFPMSCCNAEPNRRDQTRRDCSDGLPGSSWQDLLERSERTLQPSHKNQVSYSRRSVHSTGFPLAIDYLSRKNATHE